MIWSGLGSHQESKKSRIEFAVSLSSHVCHKTERLAQGPCSNVAEFRQKVVCCSAAVQRITTDLKLAVLCNQ